ncbi:aldo/keto reductase [Catellatospora sichuanensis]|uniref:aldo/keto reductase n=1 Tax=Catellatospora sichuanensis TaxID=1969805 RepID=UPI001182E4F6|nr:aldo/keto reductase [Catellatospora sichuanensis]
MTEYASRQLGRGGPAVSPVGLGCMGLNGGYGAVDRRQAASVLHQALDLGVDMFDTADAYAEGGNEELVGEVVRQRRDEVVLATKFGMRGRLGTPGAAVDTSPAWVAEACEASLRRLGVDTIDLYYVHRRDPRVPVEETVGAMAKLVVAGKVRWIGLCEVSPETLRAAHAVHPVAAVQVEYSLFTREVAEGGLLATCRELGIGLVAYSPVGRGLLAGLPGLAEQDQRRMLPRFSPLHLPHNQALAAAVAAVAAELGCTPAQAALAWVLGEGEDIVAIPGTSDPGHLAENAAARTVRLTSQQRAGLRAAVPDGAVAGERYPAAAAALLGR